MRKVLISLLMAGAFIAPGVASAQGGEPRNRHEQREDNAGSAQNDGGGQRQQSRSEQRAARMDFRQQQIQSAPAEVQVAQREGRRGGRGDGGGNWRGGGGNNDGGWRGNRGGGNDGGWRGNRGDSAGASSQGSVVGWQGPAGTENSRDAQRYNRRAQENAIRYGTQEQRREAYQERREDRRDWRQDRRDDRRDWRDDRRGDRRDWRYGNRDDRRDWRYDRRTDRRDWNRGWRNDRRYAWQDWRVRNRSLFRLSPYYSPYRNYGYQRFSIGLFLDRLFFDQRYWIDDPFYYRLPPAPPGTQWVRYYNDVLLVDVYSGEVIDAIHDFFW
jgi:hypothetical protein